MITKACGGHHPMAGTELRTAELIALANGRGFAQNFHAPRSRNPSAGRIMTTIIAALFVIGVSIGLPAPAGLLAQEYPADVSRGKIIYERHCLTCHGPRGFGDGPGALLLTIAPTNFHRSGSFLKSDETLLRMIEHGGVFSPMHSWRGRLTDGEMQDVLAYIRALSQDSR
jgi:mono/diheme cytochrome c family protein